MVAIALGSGQTAVRSNPAPKPTSPGKPRSAVELRR